MGQLEQCADELGAITRIVRAAKEAPSTPPDYWNDMRFAVGELAHKLEIVAIIAGAIDTTARATCIALLDAAISDASAERATVVRALQEARGKIVHIPGMLLELHARKQ